MGGEVPVDARLNRKFRTGGQFCAVLQNEVREDWYDKRAFFRRVPGRPTHPSGGPPDSGQGSLGPHMCVNQASHAAHPHEVESSEDEVSDRTWEPGTQDRVSTESLNRVALETALASLAPGYQTVLILHDIEGYGHKEIAEILSYTLGTSEAQLWKARMRLRSFFQSGKKRALIKISDRKESSHACARDVQGLN